MTENVLASMVDKIINDSEILDHGQHNDGVSDAVVAEMVRLGLGPKDVSPGAASFDSWSNEDEARATIQTIMEHGYALALRRAADHTDDRPDLCDECKVDGHQACSLDPTCPCCRDTISQMA